MCRCRDMLGVAIIMLGVAMCWGLQCVGGCNNYVGGRNVLGVAMCLGSGL